MGRLLSSHFMTPEQIQACCAGDILFYVIGYSIYTIDNQRIGVVDDALIDDEDFAVRMLSVNTSTAEFILNQRRVLLPADLCCRDVDAKTVRSRARAEQVQSAPEYDPVLQLAQSYEDLVYLNYGERPYAPADH